MRLALKVNAWAHRVALWASIWLLCTGASELFGVQFLPASWVLIYQWLPNSMDWMWPGLFVLAGIASVVGIRSEASMIVGFLTCGLAYFIWGSTSMYGWWTDQGGTIPGSSAYYLLWGFSWLLAHNVYVHRRIDEQVAAVEESEILASLNLIDVATAKDRDMYKAREQRQNQRGQRQDNRGEWQDVRGEAQDARGEHQDEK